MSKENQKKFYDACEEGNLATVKELAGEVDVNWGNPDERGRTGLYVACREGKEEVVRFLLDHPKIDVNKADNDGWTPLYIACSNGREEIVKILLRDERVDVNKANNGGWTPLYIACQLGREETVKILLRDERVEVNKANNEGCTPLWTSCYERNEGTVKILFASGREVDPTKKGIDYDGFPPKEYSPAEIAKKNQRDQVAKLVEEFMKNPREVKERLRKELKWPIYFGEIFGLGTLLCDGLLKIREEQKEKPIARFFKIFSKLHLDVQMVLINRSQGLKGNFIPKADRNLALNYLIQS